MRFLHQDIEMIESEQRNYLKDPNRRYVEVNPAIIAVQRLVVRQYEHYIRQRNELEHRGQGNTLEKSGYPEQQFDRV